ncbi:hypothetical protein BC831DRAFT_463547 [Entophlyctis helioformis]|nr:hypothetical protein BC831DRAFT_463547 [Entophlyctis helioformis]
MLDAEFVVCHLLKDRRNIEIHEHVTMHKYASPALRPDSEYITTGNVGGFSSGQTVCQFRRPTRPTDGKHKTIEVARTTPLLWAFNPRSGLSFRGTYFFYHGTNHRGAVSINWLSGAVTERAVIPFAGKQLHGFGMMAIWLVILPVGAFWARFGRSFPGWIYVKVILQVSGVVGIFAFFLVILNNVVYLDRPHSILGLIMLAFVIIQLFLGVGAVVGLSQEIMQPIQKYVRLSHYPRGKEVWGVFVALVIGWFGAFASAEMYWRMRVIRYDAKSSGNSSAKYKRAANQTPGDIRAASAAATAAGSRGVPFGRNAANEAGKSGFELTAINGKITEQFTWETLGQAINEGRMLVWMYSHPGGQLIMFAVNGTDISNDYFHEAGFDAEEFTPKLQAPAQRADRLGAALPRQVTSGTAPSITSGSWVVSASAGSMTGLDWQRVVKARRTHVHTRLAIQRLAQLLVGEIVTAPDALDRYQSVALSSSHTLPTEPSSDTVIFDRFEYRRYALTQKELTTPQATSAPIFRLRFCLLYPYDVRDGTPRGFLPGECVEIQARINGQLVSRYYTPLGDGNLTAFEIHVKLVPTGIMSQFLLKQRTGDRQVKIRGPFGSPLACVERPLSLPSSQWLPDRLVFIAGGTGIAPFLQLLQYVFLPTGEKLKATMDYLPNFEDELKMSVGDSVLVKHHYYDGWVYGCNLTTQAEGVFPLSCTTPRCGPRPRVVLLNSIHSANDIIGKDLLNGALLAYPMQLTVLHYIENRANNRLGSGIASSGGFPRSASDVDEPTAVPDVPGLVFDGRITDQRIVAAVGPFMPLDERHAMAESGHHGDGRGHLVQQAVVCGPPGYIPFVVDSLTEMGVPNSEMRILPNDRWIEA